MATTPEAVCPICRGERWLCENHPMKPWPPHDGCGGAGVPCVCNPHGEVVWKEVFATNETPEGPIQ